MTIYMSYLWNQVIIFHLQTDNQYIRNRRCLTNSQALSLCCNWTELIRRYQCSKAKKTVDRTDMKQAFLHLSWQNHLQLQFNFKPPSCTHTCTHAHIARFLNYYIYIFIYYIYIYIICMYTYTQNVCMQTCNICIHRHRSIHTHTSHRQTDGGTRTWCKTIITFPLFPLAFSSFFSVHSNSIIIYIYSILLSKHVAFLKFRLLLSGQGVVIERGVFSHMVFHNVLRRTGHLSSAGTLHSCICSWKPV